MSVLLVQEPLPITYSVKINDKVVGRFDCDQQLFFPNSNAMAFGLTVNDLYCIADEINNIQGKGQIQ